MGLLNTTAPWPEHVFGTPEIPTLTARTEALALLGYEPVACAQWEWSEDSTPPDRPVDLLASLKVREHAGGTA